MGSDAGESRTGNENMGNYFEVFGAPYTPGELVGFDPLKINSKGYERPDQEITDDIGDRFLALSGIDTSGVHVEINKGIATLSGKVASYRISKFLADVSRNVFGVREVHSKLTTDRAGATGADV